MIWTHIYDLIVKLGTLFLSIFALTLIPFFEEQGVLIVILSIIFSVIAYTIFLRTLGSYLYCRLTLKMPVTMKQAKTLNKGLAPIPFQFGDFSWLPLTEVKNIDDNKYDMALSLIDQWTMKRRERWQKIIEQSTGFVKFIEILMAVIFIGMLATSHFNIPPASYIIELYCKIFDTNEYHPMLIGSLTSFIFIFPLILIKKVIQKKQNGKYKS